jgi:methionine-rich copper-binding protein CopC
MAVRTAITILACLSLALAGQAAAAGAASAHTFLVSSDPADGRSWPSFPAGSS